jgi:uncharacterized lipoprotein YmbA
MSHYRSLVNLLLGAALSACASSVPVRYFSLDDGHPAAVSQRGPSVLIIRADIPELIDRPQLVSRTADHQVHISDLDQWAEPLRQQIPRVLARLLGDALDSGQVVALTTAAVTPDADYKVMLDVQRMEVVAGRAVELDALWRVQSRSGDVFYGRTRVAEPIADAGGGGGYPVMVAAQSRALGAVASDIAAVVTRALKHG